MADQLAVRINGAVAQPAAPLVAEEALPFAKLYDSVLQSDDLTPGDKLVWCAFYRVLFNGRGEYTQRQVADFCRLSERQVRNSIPRLLAGKYLEETGKSFRIPTDLEDRKIVPVKAAHNAGVTRNHLPESAPTTGTICRSSIDTDVEVRIDIDGKNGLSDKAKPPEAPIVTPQPDIPSQPNVAQERPVLESYWTPEKLEAKRLNDASLARLRQRNQRMFGRSA
jgi:hypothetical protein